MVKSLLSLFIGSLLLFVLLAPGNHSDAEDAFEYSRLIEEGTGSDLYHPHHLIYLPSQQGIFKVVQIFGYSGRSYYVARAVSMLSAALSLCLFYLIACQIAGRETMFPMVGTLGLLFSYGFLRYACEVEIYLPAMVFMLGAIYAAFHAEHPKAWSLAGIIFSSLAVLMHTITLASALVIVPFIYLSRSNGWKRAVVHVVATPIFIGVVYLFIQNTCGIFKPPIDSATEGWLRAGTLGKAAVGFGQCLISGNFLFAYEAVTGKLQAIFPYRVFTEEIFAAADMPTWLRTFAPLTFGLAAVSVFGAGCILIFYAIRRRLFDRLHVLLLLWLGGTLFPTLVLEPSNPELWILALAPLWMLFLRLLVNLPLFGRRLAFIMVGVLGVHNIVAGMGSMRSQNGDYNFRKAAWMIEHGGVADTVHTGESFVFTFYLDYWGNAKVRNVNSQRWESGAITYVFDDVFRASGAFGVRYPDFADNVLATAKELKPLCTRIYTDEFGGMWVVHREIPN